MGPGFSGGLQVKTESGTQVASEVRHGAVRRRRCEWERPHNVSWHSAAADDAEWMPGKSRDRLALLVLTEPSSWMPDRSIAPSAFSRGRRRGAALEAALARLGAGRGECWATAPLRGERTARLGSTGGGQDAGGAPPHHPTETFVRPEGGWGHNSCSTEGPNGRRKGTPSRRYRCGRRSLSPASPGLSRAGRRPRRRRRGCPAAGAGRPPRRPRTAGRSRMSPPSPPSAGLACSAAGRSGRTTSSART